MNPGLRIAAFLGAATALGAQAPKPAGKPDYFDEPQFIAAGVTDVSNRGGHGSDAVQRSADQLVKATASLASGLEPVGAGAVLRAAIARDPANAMLHHQLADVEEREKKYVDALAEYQRAAALEASEGNLFDWGSELLLHRAPEQAAAVFTKGSLLFPNSTRMLLALGAADFARGLYEEAARQFFAATDVNPSDAEPYLLLGKAASGAITQSPGFAERMERFWKFHPESAWANYYYGASLAERLRGADDRSARARAQVLLEQAVSVDPKLAGAWLELGVLFSDANDPARAVSAWQKAAAAAPSLEEPHYRLALVYRKMGDGDKAKVEMDLYEQLARQSAAEYERERSSVKQFVFDLHKPAR